MWGARAIQSQNNTDGLQTVSKHEFTLGPVGGGKLGRYQCLSAASSHWLHVRPTDRAYRVLWEHVG